MELIATFYKPATIDCYTCVFDELNPGGYNTMLAMSEDGHTFSQWTSGLYDADGDNGQAISTSRMSRVGAYRLLAASPVAQMAYWLRFWPDALEVARDASHDVTSCDRSRGLSCAVISVTARGRRRNYRLVRWKGLYYCSVAFGHGEVAMAFANTPPYWR
jgi:hypothetical protein